MVTKKELKKVQTIEDLESLGIGRVYCDISHRGGGIGFYGSDVVRHFDLSGYLPKHFGAGCNYLGGGVRGAIFTSPFDRSGATGKKAELLEELANACKRVYENLENNSGLNDEEYEDGDINWDAKATKAARKAGQRSAY